MVVPVEKPAKYTLRDTYNRLSPMMSWAKKTDSKYRTLLKKWESRQGGTGPDIRDVSEDDWVSFLMGVDEWREPRTLISQQQMLQTLLLSAGPRTTHTRYAMRSGTEILTDIPVLVCPIPPVDTSVTHAWRFDTIDVDDMGRIYDAALRLPADDRIRWASLLVFVWHFGCRRDDLLKMTWDSINCKRRLLLYMQAKKGRKEGAPVGPLPIPPAVWNHLMWCQNAGFGPDIWGFGSKLHNPSRHIYPVFYRLYQQAEVDVLVSSTGKTNQPIHGLRSASVTVLRSHIPDLQPFVTGHAVVGNIAAQVYDRHGPRMKRGLETLPIPDQFRQRRRVRRRAAA